MSPDPRSPTMDAVLQSAARLQKVVPDAVLVGDSAAALYAGHRDSFDHDHVVADLAARYETVLEAVEATDGWVTSVRASSPPMTLLGRLGGSEAGLRQLRRTVPLEVQRVDVGAGLSVVVPTAEETLRVKAYLVVQRNATRDYLDVAALTDLFGIRASVGALADIDAYYTDRSDDDASVLTALVQRLSEPAPRDPGVIDELEAYKNLAPRWHDWAEVRAVCAELADALLTLVETS